MRALEPRHPGRGQIGVEMSLERARSDEAWLSAIDDETLRQRGLSAPTFREVARALSRHAEVGGRAWALHRPLKKTPSRG